MGLPDKTLRQKIILPPAAGCSQHSPQLSRLWGMILLSENTYRAAMVVLTIIQIAITIIKLRN
ncbi:hypothetical protein [Acidisoma silvae]|uniref:Uncharacterized protein n=1 Tax=Acidisoma silvae TaxID=2802396 RepID=A0A963YQ38_9PROT|nr:hypothetical protein [Acidisoma silvae]MCB8874731.1 hypothetical protein [Acidisoma silvae]